jgi:CheY-like chemotaxis protein
MIEKKKLLIIEDDERVLRMYTRRLKKLDLSIVIATNGLDGIKQAFLLQPDLIILDIHMPEMSGIEVIKHLRANNYTGLVVACSASVSAMDTHKTLHAGCNDFIQKPVGIDFEERILNYIK